MRMNPKKEYYYLLGTNPSGSSYMGFGSTTTQLNEGEWDKSVRPVGLEGAKAIIKKVLTQIRDAESYVVPLPDATIAMGLAVDYSKKSKEHRALVFTRTMPKLIFERMKAPTKGLSNVEVVWLSTVITNDVRTLSPTELPKINRDVLEFLASTGSNGIILFDGLEYLTIHNGFEATLKFLQNTRDFIALKNGKIIYTIDPLTFTDMQRHLILRELTLLTYND